MKVTVTSIELKSFFKFFPLSLIALRILNQLKSTSCKEVRKKGLLTTHYTMTLWLNEISMREFARSGAHLKAIKMGSRIAKEVKTITYDAQKLPTWTDAIDKLTTDGKTVKF